MSRSLWRVTLSFIAGIVFWNACLADPAGSEKLDSLWTDLGLNDPVRVHRATTALAARPKEVVPFLEIQLRPVPHFCPRRLQILIRELDSDQFDIRERSSRALERLGEAIEPELRKALAGRASLEMRRRIRFLLENFTFDRLHPSPDRLRQARAIEVLEQIGDAPSRRLLGLLAEGEPEAPLTIEAKAALERLIRNPSLMP